MESTKITIQQKLDEIFEKSKPFKNKIESLISDFEKENPNIKVLAGLNKEGKINIGFFIEEYSLDLMSLTK
jgi:hypothetical protein